LFFEQSKHLHIQRLIQYPGVPGRHLAMAIWALLSTAATVGFSCQFPGIPTTSRQGISAEKILLNRGQ